MEQRFKEKNRIHSRTRVNKLPEHPRVISDMINKYGTVIVFGVCGYDHSDPFGEKNRYPAKYVEACVYFECEDKRKEFEKEGIVVRHTAKRAYSNYGYNPGCYDIVVFGQDKTVVERKFKELVEFSTEFKKQLRSTAMNDVAPLLETIAKNNVFIESVIFRGSIFNENAYIQLNSRDIDIVILYDENIINESMLTEFVKFLGDEFKGYCITADLYKLVGKNGFVNQFMIAIRYDEDVPIELNFDFMPTNVFLERWIDLQPNAYEKETFSQAVLVYDKKEHGYGKVFIEAKSGVNKEKDKQNPNK